MKSKIGLLLILSVTLFTRIYSQTYTLNWSSSFTPAWSAGAVSGSANNIGGSSVNATVNLTSPEATAITAFAGFTSPVVSSGGTPFTTQLGSNVPNLAVGMDLGAKANYVDIVIKFLNYSVSNVKFNIADIDKVSATGTTYYDEVQITGFSGAAPVTNPLLTKLVAGSNDFSISGNVATCNTTSGQGGNSASSTAEQDGTVVVDFGATILTQVSIRYRNNPAAPANPAQQAIGISNVTFQKQGVLPVKIISFNYTKQSQYLQLQWQVTDELNIKEYVVEKSLDGNNFYSLDKVAAQNSTASIKNYSCKDNAISNSVFYYRLKVIDINGNFSYSNIVLYKQKSADANTITVFPNPVINGVANIFIPQQLISKLVLVRVVAQDGKTILLQQQIPNTNLMNISLPEYFHGMALVQVAAENNTVLYSDKVLVK